MKSQYLARTIKPGRARVAQPRSLPAPINGWVTAENLLNSSPASAAVLDNWLPTPRGVQLRGGSRTVATISLEGDPVESLIAYNSSSVKKLFAATETAIFDVTAVESPTSPPDPDVSGQASGYYSFVNFTTSGGQFMTVVNGTDDLLLYEPIGGWKAINGTSTPSITGLETWKLIHVWVYRNRQFFIEGGSLVAYFLPVGSIAGELGRIDLNGVFQKGGSLVFGGTWSIYAGDGLDDKCVFVTDQGEVAIYEGSNPASASPADWRVVGRYEITPPMGRRATMRAGGDLVIATEEGMVPISAAINKDPSVLHIAAISAPIDPDWRREAVARRTLPWEVIKFVRKGYTIVSLPVTTAGQEPVAFVVNTETGKWCRFTNWDTRCMVLYADTLYFGTSDGRIKIADIGGSDDGAGIYYTIVSNAEYLGDRTALKHIIQGRATFRSSTPFNSQLSASMDFDVQLPSPPITAGDITSGEWDAANWDEAVWDAPSNPQQVNSQWVSIGRSGQALQWQMQITGALTPTPNTELLSVDVTVEFGGIVV